MSHFYGIIRGNRGNATRCGSKDSGIHATIKSWDNTVYAELRSDDKGKDFLKIDIPKGLYVIINGVPFDIDHFTKASKLIYHK